MLMEFLQKINWIDIALIAVCVRAVFIGIKTGFVVEFFKSVGIVFSVFVTLHYFSSLVVFASAHISFLELPTIGILSFLLLWAVTTLIIKLIREGVLIVFSIQAHPIADKLGGVFLSALRGVVVCGMVFYVFLLSYNPVWIKTARNSISRSAVSNLPTGIYVGIYRNFVVKFFPGEKISEEALLVPQFLDDNRFK